MVRAVYKDGQIKPIDPVPPEWADGRELSVEAPAVVPTKDELDAWEAEMREGASTISDEDFDEFERVLAEQEAESKRAVRREWGLE